MDSYDDLVPDVDHDVDKSSADLQDSDIKEQLRQAMSDLSPDGMDAMIPQLQQMVDDIDPSDVAAASARGNFDELTEKLTEKLLGSDGVKDLRRNAKQARREVDTSTVSFTPEEIDRGIAENFDEAMDKIRPLMEKTGLSEQEVRKRIHTPEFKKLVANMGSAITRINPPCEVCGQKSKSSMEYQSHPACSGKCRKQLVKQFK